MASSLQRLFTSFQSCRKITIDMIKNQKININRINEIDRLDQKIQKKGLSQQKFRFRYTGR